MNASTEHMHPFHEPDANIIAADFWKEFPNVIANKQIFDAHMFMAINAFAQRVLNATDASEMQSGATEAVSPPEARPPQITRSDGMQFDEYGKPTGIGPVMSEERPVHQYISARTTFTIGADGEAESSSDPLLITPYDALSYIANPDTPRIVRDVFNLPHSDRMLSGFRTFLIAQLCQTEERLFDWINSEQGNKDLRSILLDAAVFDRAAIERYRLRRSNLGLQDDVPITKCITEANFDQAEKLFTKFISKLTQRDIPTPEAPAPTA